MLSHSDAQLLFGRLFKKIVAEFRRIGFATGLSSRNFELGPQNRTGMHEKQPKETHWNNTYVFSKISQTSESFTVLDLQKTQR